MSPLGELVGKQGEVWRYLFYLPIKIDDSGIKDTCIISRDSYRMPPYCLQVFCGLSLTLSLEVPRMKITPLGSIVPDLCGSESSDIPFECWLLWQQFS